MQWEELNTDRYYKFINEIIISISGKAILKKCCTEGIPDKNNLCWSYLSREEYLQLTYGVTI